MRLTELVRRNMIKNMKQYYLYFFSLIFSVMLYFIFSTIQYDDSIGQAIQSSSSVSTAFLVGVIFLAVIMLVFVLYAKALFYKRRGREIGLYQLIGLSKWQVAKMLIIENLFLLAGATLIGIALGLVFARIFLLLFMKVLQLNAEISLEFSGEAILQTGVLFLSILTLTTIQTILVIQKHSLVELFRSKEQGEGIQEERPKRQAIMAGLGVLFIGFGYWLSGNMMNAFLFFNMLAVLFFTIFGTFLLFRVTISWLMERIRKRADGHLSFKNALSIAPMIHRMKSNAKLFTLITTLSAITLTLTTGAYSLYYSTAEESRGMYPHDFMFTQSDAEQAESFTALLEDKEIGFKAAEIETVNKEITMEGFDQGFGIETEAQPTTFAPFSQLQKAGINVKAEAGEGIYYGTLGPEVNVENAVITADDQKVSLIDAKNMYALNIDTNYSVTAVDDRTFRSLQETAETETYTTVNVSDEEERELANELYHSVFSNVDGDDLATYVDRFKQSLESAGMLIFISGFLGTVFLAATGSILYFKQMTEVEEEKSSYRTLRQLGFTVENMVSGIGRKQLLFFLLPLAIGLLHCYFAIQSIDFLFRTSIVVPVVISISVYTLIYVFFYVLSLTNSRKEVRAVLGK
ncbi:ABC transporter permease [Jeotgalibacillus sp. S-D1]|uniref:ABC transporter permease n=1 Tax=Jeotgalibacillus sp. S-D1 TaxID=2552189 RepID=UPI00105A8A80|nr:ABC transporter permease [Jeotgalibacillus sp. S-D1]TDL31305.1 ABC transporter permease [Jeotgalibacillus sp. S-D1]